MSILLRDHIDTFLGVAEQPVYSKKDDRFCVRTLHLRLKDKHARHLDALACQVNMVWNFCNEHSTKVLQRENRFCSAFDLHPYLAGAGKAGLDLHSQTIQGVAEEFVTRRKQFKKSRLHWRVSKGSRKSLGWIPFKESAISYKNAQVHLGGKALSLWDSFGLSNYELGSGNIAQDSRGRWYLNVTVRQYAWPLSQDVDSDIERNAVGLDLGLKDFCASSDGQKIAAQRFFRKTEQKLALAQRAGKKARAKALHAKVQNQRKDFCHQLSTALVRKHSAIFVGNVNARALSKTNMAKSVLDASWSKFRTVLQYKSDYAGVWFKEVGESFTTQECSSCHARTGPKGQEGLSVRSWTCSVCLTDHDRDTNAAINIRNRGLEWQRLQVIPVSGEEKSCEALTNKGLEASCL